MTATTFPAEHIDSAAQAADRQQIQETASKLGLLADARDWETLRELFTDSVEIDYTSLNGGEPQTVAAPDLIEGWRQVLANLEATQHLIAGHVVTIDGDHATCAANVQATHLLGNETGGPIWTVAGRYDYRFERTPPGWRISGLTLTVQWATGNQHIMQLAASHVLPVDR
ncbi:MAG TPA: nuclear transport factor 2 family protein [Nocardioides sp.]|nr:nuclear transport factor 2 family protein [Nocardioides sp.]